MAATYTTTANLAPTSQVQDGDLAVGRGQLGRAAFVAVSAGTLPSPNTLWAAAPQRPSRYFIDVTSATAGNVFRLPEIGTGVDQAQVGHVVYIKNSGTLNNVVVNTFSNTALYSVAPDSWVEVVAGSGGANDWETTDINAAASVSLQTAYNNSTNPEIVISTAANSDVTIRNDATNAKQSIFSVEGNGGTSFFQVQNTTLGSQIGVILGLGSTFTPTATQCDSSMALGVGSSADFLNALAFGNTAVAGGNRALSLGSNSNAAADSVAVGGNATATTGAQATGATSVAVGTASVASATSSVAVGNAATANTGSATVAIGASAAASATEAVALGNASVASSAQSVAVGDGATASTGAAATAVGNDAAATAADALALGHSAAASSAQSVAVGDGATASTGAAATAVGNDSTATAADALALGHAADASAAAAVAAGLNSTASAADAVAVGNSATASSAQSVAVGDGATASTGAAATAVGNDSAATAADALALGHSAAASAAAAVAVGLNAAASAAGAACFNDGSASATNAATNRALVAYDNGLQVINKAGATAVLPGTALNNPSYRIVQNQQLNIATTTTGTFSLAVGASNTLGLRAQIIAVDDTAELSWYFEAVVKANRKAAGNVLVSTPVVTTVGDNTNCTIAWSGTASDLVLTVTNNSPNDTTWNINYVLNELTYA